MLKKQVLEGGEKKETTKNLIILQLQLYMRRNGEEHFTLSMRNICRFGVRAFSDGKRLHGRMAT